MDNKMTADEMNGMAIKYWKLAQSQLIQEGDYETTKLFDELFEKWDIKTKAEKEIDVILEQIERRHH